MHLWSVEAKKMLSYSLQTLAFGPELTKSTRMDHSMHKEWNMDKGALHIAWPAFELHKSIGLGELYIFYIFQH